MQLWWWKLLFTHAGNYCWETEHRALLVAKAGLVTKKLIRNVSNYCCWCFPALPWYSGDDKVKRTAKCLKVLLWVFIPRAMDFVGSFVSCSGSESRSSSHPCQSTSCPHIRPEMLFCQQKQSFNWVITTATSRIAAWTVSQGIHLKLGCYRNP